MIILRLIPLIRVMRVLTSRGRLSVEGKSCATRRLRSIKPASIISSIPKILSIIRKRCFVMRFLCLVFSLCVIFGKDTTKTIKFFLFTKKLDLLIVRLPLFAVE